MELTEEQAKRWETRLILYYKTNNRNIGYNLTNGGEFNQLSEESKRKISETQKTRMTDDMKNHLRDLALQRNTKGENNPFYGKKHKKETREKMSKNHWSKTDPEKFRTSFTSKKKDIDNPNHKEVVRLSDGKIYNLIKDCIKDNNVSSYTVTTHCKGRLKDLSKRRFVYLEDYIKNLGKDA